MADEDTEALRAHVAGQLGDAVLVARDRTGLTQEALADRAGMHRNYVGGIERGERNPSLTQLVRLAAALGMTAAQLLDGVEPPNP